MLASEYLNIICQSKDFLFQQCNVGLCLVMFYDTFLYFIFIFLYLFTSSKEIALCYFSSNRRTSYLTDKLLTN